MTSAWQYALASGAMGVLLMLGALGACCVLGELMWRLRGFHRAGLARLKAQR